LHGADALDQVAQIRIGRRAGMDCAHRSLGSLLVRVRDHQASRVLRSWRARIVQLQADKTMALEAIDGVLADLSVERLPEIIAPRFEKGGGWRARADWRTPVRSKIDCARHTAPHPSPTSRRGGDYSDRRNAVNRARWRASARRAGVVVLRVTARI